MDTRLVAWARAVKSRRRHQRPPALPPIWLFTDAARMPDLLAVVDALPRGLCGVVFRHDAAPDRPALARATLRACRTRRLHLVIAGAALGLALPRHRRDGQICTKPHTSSAHSFPALVRARRAGCNAVFLSPAFPTRSHPGQPALGPIRWAALARRSPLPTLALGGIDGTTVKRLPRWIVGAGAIAALLP